ncbi:MAG: METTL5 family protein [Promethearchaeota archaeon]
MIIRKKELINLIESLEGFKNPKLNLEQYITDAISIADLLYFVEIDNHDILNNIIIDLGTGTGRICIGAIFLGALGAIAIEKDPNAIKIMQNNLKKVAKAMCYNDRKDISMDIENRILIFQEDIVELIKSENIDKLKKIIVEIDDFIFRLLKYYKKIQNDSSCILNRSEDTSKKDDLKSNLRITNRPSKVCIMNPPFGVHNKHIDRKFIECAMLLSNKIYSIHLSNEKSRRFLQKFIEGKGWKIEQIISQKLVIKGLFKFHKKPQKFVLTDIYKIIPKNP